MISTVEFTIQLRLPSINNYVDKCRRNKYQANNYKQKIQREIFSYYPKGVKLDNCYNVYIEWHEENRKRDVDNIQSGQKYIFDALQEYGVLENDNQKHIRQIYHQIVIDVRSYVIVRFVEVEK